MNLALFCSMVIAVFIAMLQWWFFRKNKAKIHDFQTFFNRNTDREYAVVIQDNKSQLDNTVAINGSNFAELIEELNIYIQKNRGTTDFSIIQNKTERKISSMYEYATAQLAFPTYIGLMGTFVGIFIGLGLFWWGLTGEGISDEVIGNLITGVLISMLTSFIGLGLSTRSNYLASEAKKMVDEEKNNFFEFIQNELLPSLGNSIIEALDKLHQTINLFEPAFNSVIDRFQSTFDSCTKSFGSAFELNVKVVASSVEKMGQNMDKINENVDLQEKLLTTLHSHGVLKTLNAFVSASKQFDTASESIHRYETMCTAIKEQTDALIEQQRTYNESLTIPSQIVKELNNLLNRITRFEDSINNLGTTIEQTQLLGNRTIQNVERQLSVISRKQELAERYSDIAEDRLQAFFNKQNESLGKMNLQFEQTLINRAELYQQELSRLTEEMRSRRAEIVEEINQKFSITEIRNEFAQLEKLSDIDSQLATLNTQVSDAKIQHIIDTTREDAESIRSALSALRTEIQSNAHTYISTEQLENGLAPLQKLSDIDEALKVINTNMAQDKTEHTLQQTQRELSDLRRSLDQAIKEIKASPIQQEQNRSWWPFR